MKLRSLLFIVTTAALATLSLRCSNDTPAVGPHESVEVLRLFITETTGATTALAFDPLDQRLYEQIEDLGPETYDFQTDDAEYYDFYFSTVLGKPLNISPRNILPEPVYITVACMDLGSLVEQSKAPLSWEHTGNNIDALAMTTKSGTLFGRQCTKIRYGECAESLELNDWPATNALGPPDGIVTHMGGAFSSMTIRMDDIMMGTLTLFERSNTPPITIARNFPNLDPRLYEKLPALTQEEFDFVTGDCELYDLYFSDAAGAPLSFSKRLDLPISLYVTIDCYNLNCDTYDPDSTAFWSDADSGIDALRLSFVGWHRFGLSLARVTYGVCGQLPVSNGWPAENILGIPDSTFSHMGGGFSSVTVMLADTSS